LFVDLVEGVLVGTTSAPYASRSDPAASIMWTQGRTGRGLNSQGWSPPGSAAECCVPPTAAWRL